MQGPTTRAATSPRRPRTLAETYQRFGAVGAEASPLYERIARALSESGQARRAIERAPRHRRQPALILAALHDLALAGRAPALAAAYAAADGDAAAGAAIETLVRSTDEVATIAARRRVRSPDVARCAVLYPAVAEAAHRVGASAVGLLDVGDSAGLNRHVDRVGIAYSTPRSRPQVQGDRSSAVQVEATVKGDRLLPGWLMPEVLARISLDPDPLDVTDAEDVRWLRACVAPDDAERAARLEAEVALMAESPPLLRAGDPLEVLPDALARVSADILPIVTTTWALRDFSYEERLRFLQLLDAAATKRPVAWVSVEGVGVAPAIPTLGDRRASGHSIIGLAIFDHSTLHAEAVGRCWSQGRLLSWLADSTPPARRR